MPKTGRDHLASFDKTGKPLLPCGSSLTSESKPANPPATKEDMKEWEEARCPVCMEHPHNSVLLVCSSYDKGCRPYMCDTSYRHSNCLDQYRKSFAQEDVGARPQSSDIVTVENGVMSSQEEGKTQDPLQAENMPIVHKLEQKLVCPLCRGQVRGWIVLDSARSFMNAKIRSCASESCDFNGNYTDLRKHARVEHPKVRPSDADPERQRSWRRLERQRDIGDVLSTIQSSFGEDRNDEDGDDDGILPIDERGWITIFFLFRVWSPTSGSRSSSWSGTSRARTRAQQGARRRSARLWGEGYDAEPSSVEVEDEDSSESGSVTWRRRVRRRLSTPDDES